MIQTQRSPQVLIHTGIPELVHQLVMVVTKTVILEIHKGA